MWTTRLILHLPPACLQPHTTGFELCGMELAEEAEKVLWATAARFRTLADQQPPLVGPCASKRSTPTPHDTPAATTPAPPPAAPTLPAPAPGAGAGAASPSDGAGNDHASQVKQEESGSGGAGGCGPEAGGPGAAEAGGQHGPEAVTSQTLQAVVKEEAAGESAPGAEPPVPAPEAEVKVEPAAAEGAAAAPDAVGCQADVPMHEASPVPRAAGEGDASGEADEDPHALQDPARPFRPQPEGCRVCWSTEDASRLLLCDACDDQVHCYCCSPPMAEVPAGEWYCDRCSARMGLRDDSMSGDEESDGEAHVDAGGAEGGSGKKKTTGRTARMQAVKQLLRLAHLLGVQNSSSSSGIGGSGGGKQRWDARTRLALLHELLECCCAGGAVHNAIDSAMNARADAKKEAAAIKAKV